MARKILLLAAVVMAAACIDGGYLLQLQTFECRTPIPIFQYAPDSPADSVLIGCPYAYINAFGDTVMVVYLLPVS